MIKKGLEVIKKYKEVIAYLIFGVMTTVVNWIVYSLCVQVGIGINVSNCAAWLVAVLFAFVTNKLFVFESKKTTIKEVVKEFWKFIVARLATGTIEILGLPLLMWLNFDYSLFGVEGLFTKVIVSVVVIILNYVFSKLFVFSKKD